LSDVELRHLRYFVAVAEMENVSRAATQKLQVAQRSLSRQIRGVEDEIGLALLNRRGKSVSLTPACTRPIPARPLAVPGPLSGAHVCRYWAFTFGSVRRSSGHTRRLRLFLELRFRSAIGAFQ
jgi:hypothetical protein